jgi:hypothetical protein
MTVSWSGTFNEAAGRITRDANDVAKVTGNIAAFLPPIRRKR